MNPLAKLTLPELLAKQAAEVAAFDLELRRRGMTRTGNALAGDLAEYLFCRAFKWDQEASSKSAYDATDAAGVHYQIKGRRLTPGNPSRLLSSLRGLDQHPPLFDVLAGVLFDHDYRVVRAALIPHEVVQGSATFQRYVAGWRFLLVDAIWSVPGVLDVTEDLRTEMMREG
jgi:hypothetical protein